MSGITTSTPTQTPTGRPTQTLTGTPTTMSNTTVPKTTVPKTTVPNTTVPARPIIFPTLKSDNQTKIQNFMNYVKDYLYPQSSSMKQVLEVENRRNIFNDTYRKRYIEYTKIICVIVFVLICVWLCITLDNLNFLPSGLSYILIIIIIGVSFIIIYVIYQNVLIRNIIQYDEIDYKSPSLIKNITNASTSTTTSTSTPLPECTTCPTGYVYNNGYCEVNNTSGIGLFDNIPF